MGKSISSILLLLQNRGVCDELDGLAGDRGHGQEVAVVAQHDETLAFRSCTPGKRPGYGATSDQNTCTSKWPLDGSGSP